MIQIRYREDTDLNGFFINFLKYKILLNPRFYEVNPFYPRHNNRSLYYFLYATAFCLLVPKPSIPNSTTSPALI